MLIVQLFLHLNCRLNSLTSLQNYIKAYSIGEAWLLALKSVVTNGVEIRDDKGPIRELIPLFIEIIHPSITDKIIDAFGDKNSLKFLSNNFGDSTPIKAWGYSYAQRLYFFNNINQIDDVINKLNENPYSKSAAISLLNNTEDKKHKPCLIALDFKIRNDILIINATFRSQDIGKKMYGDALEILKLGKNIILKVPANEIIIILSISSAHIYLIDLDMVHSILDDAKEEK